MVPIDVSSSPYDHSSSCKSFTLTHPSFSTNQTLISRDQSTQPQPELDFPADTDDIDNPVWLLKKHPFFKPWKCKLSQ